MTPTELEGLFFLDDFDRDLVARRRGDENRIGFGLQVATVRALGRFLADPLEVPTEAVDYIAGQVGAADPSVAEGYLRREKTRFEHQREIAEAYGYSDFTGAEPDLVCWIDDRAWTTGDGPKAIFDAAVGWLRERKGFGATRYASAVFTGLDDIDWESLRHAYGSAEDVPAWVRGLIDPDPAVREESLDAMYGAVHHQGDIYDSTVAAVPYLIEALTAPGLPGREGIVELLTSIAELGDWPDDADLDEDDAEMRRHATRANAIIAAAAPALLRLVDDLAPPVRAAAPKLLVALAATIPDLPGLFLGLLGTEADAEVRMGLFEALGSLQLGDEAIRDLLGLARSAQASTALAALIAVTRTGCLSTACRNSSTAPTPRKDPPLSQQASTPTP